MIGFNHSMAGVIIAATVPPLYIPFVALISHFVMDALPHFGNSETFKPYTKPFKFLLVLDALLCFGVLGLGWWLWPERWLMITVGVFFAAAPDFLWLLEGKVRWLKGYFVLAKKIQWSESPDGWTYELIYFSLMFTILVTLV